MENKYFTPSIEDIRIGYEIESHEWSMDEAEVPELNYDRWITKKLDKNYVQTLLQYGINHIRVPYISKEQIIAEGWRDITNPLNIGHWTFEKSNRFAVITLNDMENPFILVIIIKDPSKETLVFGMPSECFRFTIPCKDINTFRYICKLLGI